jgi:hypothetical protein
VPHPRQQAAWCPATPGYAASYVVERRPVVSWPGTVRGGRANADEDLSSQEVCSVPEITPGSQPVLPCPGPGRLRHVITTQPGRA